MRRCTGLRGPVQLENIGHVRDERRCPGWCICILTDQARDFLRLWVLSAVHSSRFPARHIYRTFQAAHWDPRERTYKNLVPRCSGVRALQLLILGPRYVRLLRWPATKPLFCFVPSSRLLHGGPLVLPRLQFLSLPIVSRARHLMASASQSQGADPPDALLLALVERVEARTRASRSPGLDIPPGREDKPQGPQATGDGLAGDEVQAPEQQLDALRCPVASSGHHRQRSRSVFEGEHDQDPHVTPSASTANIADLARCLKRARRLGPQSEIDLDIFVAAQPIAREAQQYAVALECRDMLKTVTLEQEHKMPETLKVCITLWI
ncbi:hypothetical protein OH77DRAFT_1594545 [Trametes cingulata]|nr:hypothetical protein OH77DRAFT_1594545 [Trametes cingulata]